MAPISEDLSAPGVFLLGLTKPLTNKIEPMDKSGFQRKARVDILADSVCLLASCNQLNDLHAENQVIPQSGSAIKDELSLPPLQLGANTCL